MLNAGPMAPADAAAHGADLVRSRRATAIVFVLALLPVAVALSGLVGRDWHPPADYALELLRVEAIGGANTPLTGVYSRWGWDHPGPLLFYALAPFAWTFGPVGALVAAAAVNGASITGALIVARRRGGWPLLALVAFVVLILATALGPRFLIDPWNPWIAVVPFLAFVMMTFAIGDGDLAVAPWMVAVGTFCVQAHVGYLIPVLGLGAVAAVMAWWGRRRAPAPRAPRRGLLLALGVAIVLWLPPIVQQITGAEGNFGLLVEYAREPPEPTAGWHRAVGVLGTELGFPGAWLMGGDDNPFGVPASPVWPAVLLLTVAALLGSLALHRGHVGAFRLTVLALTASALGVVATARVTGALYHYVVRWWWVIAALVWLSVLWSTCVLLRGVARAALLAGAMTGSVILAVVLGWRAVPAELPSEDVSMAIADLGGPVAAALDRDLSYSIDWLDPTLSGVGDGMLLELQRKGYDVSAPPHALPSFEEWQIRRPEDVDSTVLLVNEDEHVPAFRPPEGARLLVRRDPLSVAQRARTEELRAAKSAQLAAYGDVDAAQELRVIADGGVDPQLLEELDLLETRGDAYAVYLIQHGST